jgi:hypothetical protein
MGFLPSFRLGGNRAGIYVREVCSPRGQDQDKSFAEFHIVKSVFYTSGQISQIFLKLLDINPQWSLGFAVDFCDHMKGGK